MGVNMARILISLRKILKKQMVFISLSFLILLSLCTLGLYKSYSKPETRVETNSEVKGEAIQNDKDEDSQNKVLDVPITTTKPDDSHSTTPSGATKQSAQTNSQEPSVVPAPTTPTEKSWTNSHGTFKYSDLGKTVPMYLGKDVSFQVGWTTNGVCSGKITIPQNTKIYTLYTQVPNYISVPGDEPTSYPNPRRQGDFIFDLREYYPSICQLYYYEEHFSDDPNSPYYPGNLDVWW